MLALGVPYVGADFRLDPPARAPFELPSIAVVGTGKRVGKTAVTGHLARLLAGQRASSSSRWGGEARRSPRWSPFRRPSTRSSSSRAPGATLRPTTSRRLRSSASRRSGAGAAEAGSPAPSRPRTSPRARASRSSSSPTSSSSTAAAQRSRRSPPTGRSSSSAGTRTRASAAGYLNAYRLLLADLVVVTMAEAGTGWEAVQTAVRSVVRPGVPVVATVLRPRPLVDVRGRTVAYFCTAPPEAHARASRAPRGRARRRGRPASPATSPIATALRDELETSHADVFLVELKAAAIDVVAEAALARGARGRARRERRRAPSGSAGTLTRCSSTWPNSNRERAPPRLPLPLGDEIPFSKGLMARALVVTGLDPERAYLIARRADRDLAERGAVVARPRPPRRARRRADRRGGGGANRSPAAHGSTRCSGSRSLCSCSSAARRGPASRRSRRRQRTVSASRA